MTGVQPPLEHTNMKEMDILYDVKMKNNTVGLVLIVRIY